MRKLTFFVALIAAGILSSLPPAARADTEPMFDSGSFTLHTYGSIAAAVRGDEHEFGTIAVGSAYYLADGFALGLEAAGIGVNQDEGDTYGGGLAVLARLHLINTEQFTVFLDVSSGPFQTADRVPDDGTHFNFLTRAGVGITLPLNDDWAIMAGARYFHLSNARVHGSDQNPGLDGIEGYVGLIWKL